MDVLARVDGTYDVTIRDDAALVCATTPSTLTGVAAAERPGRIVIAEPKYLCKDGREPVDPSGPLADRISNLTFLYDYERDELNDSLGLAWDRLDAAP
jgi:hypothetical protein